MSEISLELLVGRPVFTREGARLGRIEEIRANDSGEVTEFVIGHKGLLERLSSLGLFSRQVSGYVVRWDQIGLHDLSKLSLTCDTADLRRL
jgi:sporulation protein YlmC with PRC-barrel domain